MEDGLKAIGNLDIAVKWSIGIGTSIVAASAITLPNNKDKEKAALDLFDRPMAKLTPQERKAAEFHAGHGRWKVSLFENLSMLVAKNESDEIPNQIEAHDAHLFITIQWPMCRTSGRAMFTQ